MPRGPKGEKCLADVVGNAVLVMKIATCELEDQPAQITIGRLKRLNSFKSYAIGCFHLDIAEVRNRGGQTLPFRGARSMIDSDCLISTRSFRGAYGTQVVAANADAA